MNSALLTKSSSVEEADVDRSIVKIALLAAAGVISFSLFGYFLRIFLMNNDSNFILWIAVAAAVLLAIIFLQVLFIKDIWRINFISLIEVLALVAAFYDKLIDVSILPLGALLFLLFLLFANYLGLRELRNTLNIDFWRISRTVLPKAIAGLFLFFSFAFIGITAVQGNFPISRENFEKLFLPGAKIFQRFMPDFDPSLKINELALNLANKQIQENPQLQTLSKSDRNQFIKQSAEEFENNISRIFGDSINTQLKISEAIYEMLRMKFAEAVLKNQFLFIVGISIALFFIMESAAMPVRLIITVLTFIIYEILIALGFVYVTLENRSREIIVLK